MAVYYNEWDENAAAWIRALIDAGELPAGHVDTRSIRDVRPEDLVGYRQWHFFAGIGGWPLAIRMAGLEGLPGIATGSPPCQPFSVAGKGLGQDDERHLAPVWLDLILSIRPQFIAGEQVWAAVRQRWLDDLFDRAEDTGYACGAACLPAAGIGAPHQRDRLFFSMADANSGGWSEIGRHAASNRKKNREGARDRARNGCENGQSTWMADTSREFDNRGWGVWKKGRSQHSDVCGDGWMGNADCERREIDALLREEAGRWQQGQDPETARAGDPNGVADANGAQRDRITGSEGCIADRAPSERDKGDCLSQSGSTSIRSNPFLRQWNDPDWLFCRDGKWRPVEPKSFPLADGVSKIMGPCGDPSSYLDRNPQAWRAQRLKGYGNAIVPQIGAAFLTNCMQALSEVGGCA